MSNDIEISFLTPVFGHHWSNLTKLSNYLHLIFHIFVI